MFCKSCGNQIDNDSIFCSFCGTKQSDIYKPAPNHINSLGETQPKTVVLNSSFGQQSRAKQIPESTQQVLPKYDLTYKKESEATFFGVFLLVVSFIFAITGPIKYDTEDSYNQSRVVSSIVALLIRIIAIIWVANITKKQNREPFGWGLLAFFLPSIALIIVGQLKKIYNPNEKTIVTVIGEIDEETSDNSKTSQNKESSYSKEKANEEEVKQSTLDAETDHEAKQIQATLVAAVVVIILFLFVLLSTN